MTAPLAGFRVIEFGNLLAAPYACLLLADLGAEVIKVEPPEGDLARRFGPFVGGESTFFLAVNRGKKSVVLDLKEEADRSKCVRLLGTANALVHNMRWGVMERLGLGRTDLGEAIPNLIYCTISAFGAAGPDAKRPGVDIVFQGESGMIALTGYPHDGPQKTATTIGDFMAGTNAALAVAAALAAGSGRYIDVPLRDGLIAVQAGWNGLFFGTDAQPERIGTASPYLAPNQVFASSDGFFTLAITSDRHYQLLCNALELPIDYPTNEERMVHRTDLVDRLQQVFSQANTERWLTLLTATGLPCGRLLTLPEVFTQPQVVHNEMIFEAKHPSAGTIRLTGSPIRFDGEATRSSLPPPLLGQHTELVLSNLPKGDRL